MTITDHYVFSAGLCINLLNVNEINCYFGEFCRWPVASASVKKHEKKEEADEDIDLFGSDDEEEDEEKARITAERLKVTSLRWLIFGSIIF